MKGGFLFRLNVKQFLISCQIFIQNRKRDSTLLYISRIKHLKFSKLFDFFFLWLDCFLKEIWYLIVLLLFLRFWFFEFSLCYPINARQAMPFYTILNLRLFVLCAYTLLMVLEMTSNANNSKRRHSWHFTESTYRLITKLLFSIYGLFGFLFIV